MLKAAVTFADLIAGLRRCGTEFGG